MKSGIHPTVYDVVYVDSTSGAKFISTSTKKTEETMTIDGKEYFVVKVELSSDTHPFYTGKQMLLDTAGRIDKFKAKLEKTKALQQEAAKNVEVKEEKAEEKKEEKAETEA